MGRRKKVDIDQDGQDGQDVEVLHKVQVNRFTVGEAVLMNRRGVIYVGIDLIKNSVSSHIYWEMIKQLGLLVIRAEALFGSWRMQIEAFSPFFEQLSPGSKAPEYDVIVEVKEHGADPVITVVKGEGYGREG